MKAALPGSLSQADRVYCFAANLGWDAGSALAPLGARAQVFDDLDALVADRGQPSQRAFEVGLDVEASEGGLLGLSVVLTEAPPGLLHHIRLVDDIRPHADVAGDPRGQTQP